MTDFNNNDIATHYDNYIAKVVPAYELMAQIAVLRCQQYCVDKAKILVVGAGSGYELSLLCRANPTWQFVAVEPAQAMLEKAKQHCQSDAHRITWHHGTLETLPDSDFSMSVCLLVIHFLADEQKRDLLALMQNKTVENGRAIISQRLLCEEEKGFLDTEIAYAVLNNAVPESLENMRQRLPELPAISADNFVTMCHATGWQSVTAIASALSYQLVELQHGVLY